MRHTSFVPSTIPHTATRDTVLCGYEIPKDTVIFVNQYSVNHDEQEWDSPEKFCSKRFLDKDGNLVNRPADKYMIFSTGARKCPGENYVLTIGCHLMASLLSLCTFAEHPDAPASFKTKYSLSMRPLPFKVKIHLRKAMLYQTLIEEEQLKTPNDKVPTDRSPDSTPPTTPKSTESPTVNCSSNAQCPFGDNGNQTTKGNTDPVVNFYEKKISDQREYLSSHHHNHHVIDSAIS